MNISEWNQQQTIIGHLKVRYAGVQEGISKTALRLRVERLLSNADFRLPGLSTGAVLIVRKLDSPISIGVSALSQSVQANWHERLRNQITALYATAARPMLGTVPLNTPCVFFADPGEMLTCLTRDLLSGQVGERWYWQQVLRNVPHMPSTALPVLWCEQAIYVPTVLTSLHPAEIVSAMTHLTPLAVKQIIHSLHESFNLPPKVLTAIESSKLADISHAHTVTDDQPVDNEPIVSSLPTAHLPPWEQWLPSTLLPTLLPEVCYLLGLGLALYHAPTFARSQRFAAQATHWLQAEHGKQSHMPDRARLLSQDSLRISMDISTRKQDDGSLETGLAQDTIPMAPTLSSTHLGVRPEAKAQKISPAEQDSTDLPVDPLSKIVSVEEGPSEAKVQKISPPGQDSADLQVDPLSKIVSGEEQSLLVHDGNSDSLSTAMEADSPSKVTDKAAVFPSQEQSLSSPSDLSHPATPDASKTKSAQNFVTGSSKALPTDGISTRLGGVLYLINLLTWLNLPHSWGNDGTVVEHMSGWAIVEALARVLLGDLHEQYIHDPIWHALALLDGREPGMSMTAGGRLVENRLFRLPIPWLKRLGSSTWSAFQDGERILLYDDVAGYLIADVPLQGRSFFEVAHAEVAAYGEQGLEANWHLGSAEAFPLLIGSVFTEDAERSISAYLDEDVLWWLSHVLGFVYTLLAHALGESLDMSVQLAELLLCRHGQLIVSRTHVDLHMSMEEISIAVRRAGLDRDPGWVPDLGRIVYFHFD